MESEYTINEAIQIITAAIDRKRREIRDLEKKRHLKKEDRIKDVKEFIDYTKADMTTHITILANMKDDDFLLESLNPDFKNIIECPMKYDQYIDGLSSDDLENEFEANEVRAKYCDEVVEVMCCGIGETALKSKKMMNFLLNDLYAVEVFGELIFYDDHLYEIFRALTDSDGKNKDGKGKKKKKKRD